MQYDLQGDTMSYLELTRRLTDVLGLQSPPVGVKIQRPNEAAPAEFVPSGRKMRICQAVMEAGWGKTNSINPTDISCGPGPGYFGAPMGEKVVSGDAHVGLGLFSKAEAARRNFGANIRLSAGSVQAVLVGPASKFTVDPDTTVIKANAEQALWIIHSRSYSEGRHMVFEIQTESCFCSGVSLASIVKNEVQIGFGCYGSRNNTDMGINEIVIGIPTPILQEVVETLEKLKDVMARAKAKKGFYVQYPDRQPVTQRQ